jgi:hypothetical protein
MHHRLAFIVVVALAATSQAAEVFRPLIKADLSNWEGVGGSADNWQIEDGVLSCTGKAGAQWLATREQFDDFELELDFKLPSGGNSGIFIRAPRHGNPWITGMEIQLLDDGAEEWKDLKPEQFTASIYGAVAPLRRVTKPAGQWQTMRIRCVGRACSVWVNSEKVIDTDLDELADQLGAAMPGLKRNTGYIGLQNHGSPVSFRKLRIRSVQQ